MLTHDAEPLSLSPVRQSLATYIAVVVTGADNAAKGYTFSSVRSLPSIISRPFTAWVGVRYTKGGGGVSVAMVLTKLTKLVWNAVIGGLW